MVPFDTGSAGDGADIANAEQIKFFLRCQREQRDNSCFLHSSDISAKDAPLVRAAGTVCYADPARGRKGKNAMYQ